MTSNGQQAAGSASGAGSGRRWPVVDVHCHVLTREVEELVETAYSREHIVANEPYDLYAGAASREHNASLAPTLRPKLTDPDKRLEDMDRTGIDVQLLATFVSQFYYWTDPALGARLARLQNDHLAEIVRGRPDRFTALGTVPLQDPERAVSELTYLVGDLGFKGVQISSNVAGVDLDDPRFRPFFARAEELGAAVLIHPNGFTEASRFRDFYLTNVVGNPMDSTLAVTRLIFAGVLADHPALKLCVVHGGGYLPFYFARMDHAYEVRPECRAHISEPPSTYLRTVHFDTMVFDPRLLGHLVEFAGTDRVMLGTDYPFDMGEDDPLGLIDRVPGLHGDEADRLAGGNAARFFGIG